VARENLQFLRGALWGAIEGTIFGPRPMGPGWVKTQAQRDENDILKFDFKLEWACNVGT
jgi:hypothetical protein